MSHLSHSPIVSPNSPRYSVSIHSEASTEDNPELEFSNPFYRMNPNPNGAFSLDGGIFNPPLQNNIDQGSQAMFREMRNEFEDLRTNMATNEQENERLRQMMDFQTRQNRVPPRDNQPSSPSFHSDDFANSFGQGYNQLVPLRERYNPGNYTRHSWIQYPRLAVRFELKTNFIGLLPKYSGLPHEDPHQHLQRFLDLCDTVYYPDVSEELIKLKAFPFTLIDKAEYWIRNLGRVVSTWDELKREFLLKYFPIGRTQALRNQINNFSTLQGESFHESWERFKELLEKCPHHGIDTSELVQIFYGGLPENTQGHVDSACGGSYLSKDEDTIWDIFEQMAETSQAKASIRIYERTISRTLPQVNDTHSESKDNSSLNMGIITQQLDKIATMAEQLDYLHNSW